MTSCAYPIFYYVWVDSFHHFSHRKVFKKRMYMRPKQSELISNDGTKTQ